MPQLTFGTYEQGVHTEAQFGKLSISGQDEFGFRPFFLITSGVVGCATGVLRRELDARGVKYGDIQVVADVTRNPAIANRIEQIDLDFQIALKGDVAKQTLDDAMEATLRTSSMVETVRQSIQVAGRVTVVPA